MRVQKSRKGDFLRIRAAAACVMVGAMIGSTFAHPYPVQVAALWISFLPIAAMAGLMLGSLLRGDRGRPRLSHIRVPN